MAQIIATASDVTLSTGQQSSGTKPARIEETVTLYYVLPDGATLTSAYQQFTSKSPKYGGSFTMNGQKAEYGITEVFDVTESCIGSDSFSVSFSFLCNWGNALSSAGASSLAISGISLTLIYTLPATTFMQSSTSVTAGESVTATLDTSDLTPTRKYVVSLGSYSNTISVTSQVTAIPLGLAMQYYMPNSSSEAVTITQNTYDSSGDIVHTCSKTVALQCPTSAVPIIGSVSTSGVNLIQGCYMQNISKAVISASSVSGIYGSSIQRIVISGGGCTYTSTNSSSASLLTGVLRESGIVTFTVTVIDSRGSTTSSTYSIAVRAYEQPLINVFKVERCNEDGTLNAQSVYAKVVVDYSYYATYADGTDNIAYTILKYKKTDDSDWITIQDYELLGSKAPLLLTDPSTGDLLSFPIDVNYDFEITILDRYDQAITISDSLGTGYIFMRWEPTNNVISLGCYPTQGIQKCLQLADDWTQRIGSQDIYNLLYPVGAVISYATATDPSSDFPNCSWSHLGTQNVGDSTVHVWKRTA